MRESREIIERVDHAPNELGLGAAARLQLAKDRDDFVIAVNNYTPVVRRDYRIGVPVPGRYAEVLNTDAREFGGSDVRNAEVETEPIEWHGFPQSVVLTLPPLAGVWLRRR